MQIDLLRHDAIVLKFKNLKKVSLLTYPLSVISEVIKVSYRIISLLLSLNKTKIFNSSSNTMMNGMTVVKVVRSLTMMELTVLLPFCKRFFLLHLIQRIDQCPQYWIPTEDQHQAAIIPFLLLEVWITQQWRGTFPYTTE